MQNIVVFENNIPAEHKKLCESAGLQVYTLDDVYKKGCESKDGITLREPTPDTCSAFSYTSGTTGDPKGVKLTHSMLIQSAYAVMVRAEVTSAGICPITENDRYISYLPAAHSFE